MFHWKCLFLYRNYFGKKNGRILNDYQNIKVNHYWLSIIIYIFGVLLTIFYWFVPYSVVWLSVLWHLNSCNNVWYLISQSVDQSDDQSAGRVSCVCGQQLHRDNADIYELMRSTWTHLQSPECITVTGLSLCWRRSLTCDTAGIILHNQSACWAADSLRIIDKASVLTGSQAVRRPPCSKTTSCSQRVCFFK